MVENMKDINEGKKGMFLHTHHICMKIKSMCSAAKGKFFVERERKRKQLAEKREEEKTQKKYNKKWKFS